MLGRQTGGQIEDMKIQLGADETVGASRRPSGLGGRPPGTAAHRPVISGQQEARRNPHARGPALLRSLQTGLEHRGIHRRLLRFVHPRGPVRWLPQTQQEIDPIQAIF